MQAKRRVERANRTLQDRLVKELRLAGISDMDAANALLPIFTERYNAKFAKNPLRADNLHRPMNIEPDQLRDVFCFRDERLVGAQLAFSYERQRIILVENEITRGLPGKYVDTYAFPDRRFEVRWKGVSISCSIFDKDQRSSRAHQNRTGQGASKKTARWQASNALSADQQTQQWLELKTGETR